MVAIALLRNVKYKNVKRLSLGGNSTGTNEKSLKDALKHILNFVLNRYCVMSDYVTVISLVHAFYF